MARVAGSPRAAVAGVPFSSTHEKAILDSYFRVPAAPDPRKPYRALWAGDGEWVVERAAETNIQRQKRDRANKSQGFNQRKAAGGQRLDTWSIRPAAAEELAFPRVRLVDLAIWFGRRNDVADLQELLDWFKAEFHLAADAAWDLVPGLYEDGIPPEYLAIPLDAVPLDDADIAELVGAPPPPTTVGDSLDDICRMLEAGIRASRFVVPDGLVGSVMRAWLRGDLVVLMGQPGTGKTRFAGSLTDALAAYLGIAEAHVVAVREDFDETQLIGYENLKGQPVLRPFAKRVLQPANPQDPVMVIFEEFNLATVESYLSSVLIALQESSRTVDLPADTRAVLPRDFFAIATCNSYLDEETRTRLSFPLKRRACVIEMPNMLYEEYAAKGRQAITSLAIERIKQEADEVALRVTSLQGSAFDGLRGRGLSSVQSQADLQPSTVSYLESIVATVLESPEGAAFMTLALLRDLALELAFAARGDEAAEHRVLVSAVETKLLPQLRGPHARADELLAAMAGLPGLGRIEAELARMRSFNPDELTTPV